MTEMFYDPIEDSEHLEEKFCIHCGDDYFPPATNYDGLCESCIECKGCYELFSILKSIDSDRCDKCYLALLYK